MAMPRGWASQAAPVSRPITALRWRNSIERKSKGSERPGGRRKVFCSCMHWQLMPPSAADAGMDVD